MALVQAITADGNGSDRAASSAAEFLEGQVRRPVAPVRLAYAAGMIAFRVSVALQGLRGFTSMPRGRGMEAVRRWAWGPNPFKRQLFRAAIANALLAYYDHPDVKAGLDSMTQPGGQDKDESA